MNEAELAERCGKGDNLARKQLYERYAGQLMAICIRYIGDRETAQDVLHDGFLNIFRSFDKFTYKGEGSLKAWLARVMVNEALGYLRKQSSANQLYHRFKVEKFMVSPAARIYVNDSMEEVMRKFDDTKAWNLPVIDELGKYKGFVSKSKIFNSYRQVLVDFSAD